MPANGADGDVDATIKVLGRYEQPCWREASLSGEVVCSISLFSVVYADTSHDSSVAALVGFGVGDKAGPWVILSPADRRSQAKEPWARCLGDAACRPVEHLEPAKLKDRGAGGSALNFLFPGALRTGAASLRAPCGRVHWAGTQTTTEWAGFLDGAIQAGERAAEEALRELG